MPHFKSTVVPHLQWVVAKHSRTRFNVSRASDILRKSKKSGFSKFISNLKKIYNSIQAKQNLSESLFSLLSCSHLQWTTLCLIWSAQHSLERVKILSPFSRQNSQDPGRSMNCQKPHDKSGRPLRQIPKDWLLI